MDFYFLIFLNTLFLILAVNTVVQRLRGRYLAKKHPDISIYHTEGRIVSFGDKTIKTQKGYSISY